ncbi:MAG TPA: hypothetical protein DIW40_04325 [Halomonas sp.]|nr:hypothetical protein [Halomonas sp.]
MPFARSSQGVTARYRVGFHPCTVHRSPFTVHRSPFTVHRSPLSVSVIFYDHDDHAEDEGEENGDDGEYGAVV